MNEIKVKICGMRNVVNIVEVAILHPDYMGFVFYERSPRYAVELNHAVLNFLHPYTLSVGVFVNAEMGRVVETAEYYRFNALQLHGNETPEYCAELKAKYNCEIIKAFGIKSEEDFSNTSAYEQVCDYFLFDAKTELYGGSGSKFDHSLLVNYKGKKPFFLSGGITLDDAANIRDNRHELCIGIDVNSYFEISPGLKNVQQVKKLLQLFKEIPNEQDTQTF
ncbi:MAG: phosphoribosylanthranilate isomerase [Prevotellaceae bacterium]|jgi:phosphoribosylanthranilate isomerase|nr:phosphoribosylanthranilate isomerase [Prevotellaceae bacterium]